MTCSKCHRNVAKVFATKSVVVVVVVVVSVRNSLFDFKHFNTSIELLFY